MFIACFEFFNITIKTGKIQSLDKLLLHFPIRGLRAKIAVLFEQMALKKLRKEKNKAERQEKKKNRSLNPETKRGIFVVILFAISGTMLLGLFGLAGSAGEWVDGIMAEIFGIDRPLVPLLLLIIGASMIIPERQRLSIYNYIGIILFFLSFNGIINIVVLRSAEPSTELIARNGGYIGLLLQTILGNLFGFWGAIVIDGAILIVAILLIFNTSLRSFGSLHTHITGRIGIFFHNLLPKRHSGNGEETFQASEISEFEVMPQDESLGEQNPNQTPDQKTEIKAAQQLPIETKSKTGERVLTTTLHRKVEIPLNLLDKSSTKANSGDIVRNKEIIHKTYEQFGILVEMGEVEVGPTVAQYTLRPAQGVKLARIVNLQNDLALALAAHPIRIEAPIPGKSLVGIEVPNQRSATVTLREMLESKPFKERKSTFTVPIGIDVSGSAWVAPIEKMPHLLVAGATGSGKSVFLNSLIVSLMYQNGPDELKFIMVDPKRVELTAYEGIPHLLVPPITGADETINALKWTVREMERRLEFLSRFRARDIASYNASAKDRMPRIIVIIDELADLMTVAGKDVETLIIRIAQMARAVGIHLVLATQRPSVDVITGLIKANIPARIAFAVASQTDSRTILDCGGAEKLLGRGDMLYTCAELSKPKRLQGAFVSEKETRRIVEFLSASNTPDYNYDVVQMPQDSKTIFGNADTDEPLLNDALDAILEAGKASTSLLQRRLKLGYARAARIIDILEEQGIVGPADGARPRDILIKENPFKEGAENNFSDSEEDESDYEDESETESDETGEEEEEKEAEDETAEDEEEETEEINDSIDQEEENEAEEDEEEFDEDEYLKQQDGEYLDETK
ncbi:MAG: hypothetical protein ACD_63C00261G0001 [uncultured bacterium]|nr:MAG: hypothetical protein ACD_63C00261G0001 [uncultured bacterium]